MRRTVDTEAVLRPGANRPAGGRLAAFFLHPFPRATVFAAAALTTMACTTEPSAPDTRTGPPYLAVVTSTRTPAGITVTTPYAYRVEELSQSLQIDTTLVGAPADTIILSVPPASYQVSLSGIPPKCRVQGGTAQSVVIPEGTNTALLRFLVICEAQVFLENLTEGLQIDPEFIYRMEDASGNARIGLLRANDTLLLDGFTPGPHTFRLSHVGSNCQVVSNGGAEISVEIPSTGTATVALRVACSDPLQQPQIVSLHGSYHGGTNGFVLAARDPDRDIERLHWDLTDCQRRSVLTSGGRQRSGLSPGGFNVTPDTLMVMGAYEVGLPDTDMATRCVAVRVIDRFGNTSETVEAPLTGGGGQPPFALSFNAVFLGTQAIRTTLSASDSDDDYLGVFAAARLRDGVLGPPDGKPDFGVYNPVGYLGTTVPDLPLGDNRPAYSEYYSIILFLFDRAGNFRRLEDIDLFR